MSSGSFAVLTFRSIQHGHSVSRNGTLQRLLRDCLIHAYLSDRVIGICKCSFMFNVLTVLSRLVNVKRHRNIMHVPVFIHLIREL
jgi:hypothetical protein